MDELRRRLIEKEIQDRIANRITGWIGVIVILGFIGYKIWLCF